MSDVQGHAGQKPAIDENEDLFSFDELTEPKAAPVEVTPLAQGSGGAPAARDPNEEAMAAVLGPAPGSGAIAVATTSTKTESAAAHAAATANSSANDASRQGSALEPAGLGTRRSLGDLRASPLLLVGLVVFALANLALIGLTWKSMATLQQSLGARAADGPGRVEQPSNQGYGTYDTQPGGHAAKRIPAQLDPRSEGDETLEIARASLERGDYEGARRLLWGLLSVADRWPLERRDDLEARAMFMIAETFRRQADARAAREPAESAAAGADESDEPKAEPSEAHR